MARHSLDPWPIPKDKSPLYINEPWLIDRSLLDVLPDSKDELQADKIDQGDCPRDQLCLSHELRRSTK